MIEFAGKMRYKKLGLVFCIALRKEARVVEKASCANGFTVVSGVCKMGRAPKERLGVRDDQKIRIGGFERRATPSPRRFCSTRPKPTSTS